ncbi:hypothetical protein CAPTEDRAFT_203467 [Capitella teleta]|uniref:P-type ATPase C-terminal domain-containing protein n=1 Tax=Capitella teleta TaxID=283909 RepID=R7V6N2_CAPTE|nr:hypothetical protein CAPTEDRAFT_203467 [Capitella teleta]|eukprot:ELU14117.1 hypothetical protein CAPTEDRAFT_203467 [Capitella teleta]
MLGCQIRNFCCGIFLQIGVYDYGSIIMTACVFGVNAKLMLETYHWNAIVFFGFALTLVGYFVTGFFYSAFTWDFISYEFSYYHSFENVLNSVYIWFLIFVLTMIAIIPDIIIRGLRDNFSVLYAHVPSNKVNNANSNNKNSFLLDDQDDDCLSTVSSVHRKSGRFSSNGDETHSVTSSTMLVEKYTSNCYDNPAYNVYLEGPGYEGIALQEVKNSPSYANPLIQATYM